MTETIIETRELSKTYQIGDRAISVLDAISLSIKEAEFVAVSGNSGSGKTTLLSILSGLDRPSRGRVLVAGKDITDLSEDALAPFRNKVIGFVFQAFHLIPSLSALENVMFPAELCEDPDAREKGMVLLGRVGLQDRCSNKPMQLSGGEKQRVAICRALINKPRLVFADEPTGNLDSGSSRDILGLMMELHKESNTTLVMATHSQEIVNHADRTLHLKDGRLVPGNGTGS